MALVTAVEMPIREMDADLMQARDDEDPSDHDEKPGEPGGRCSPTPADMADPPVQDEPAR
jgi:hypothetical protein